MNLENAIVYEANMKFTGALPPISFDSAWPICTGESDGLPRTKFEQGNVRGSIVSPDCVIKGYVENSVLAPGVCVDEKAVVRNSVVMSRTLIGYHSMVDSSILDEAVDVGKFCYVGFGSSRRLAKKDITVLGKGAKVPSHTAVGRNCKVLPDAGEADFTTSVVPSGAVVGQG